MQLTNRDAMAYVLWRWADQNGRPIHVAAAEEVIDEALALASPAVQRAAARRWRRRRKARR